MSLRLTTTELADSDIRDIATYIALNNAHAARLFGRELWERFQAICQTPQIGRSVPGYGNLRVVRVSGRFWRYLLLYRLPDSETLEVVRVLHGARDLTALLHDIL